MEAYLQLVKEKLKLIEPAEWFIKRQTRAPDVEQWSFHHMNNYCIAKLTVTKNKVLPCYAHDAEYPFTAKLCSELKAVNPWLYENKQSHLLLENYSKITVDIMLNTLLFP